MLIFYISEGFPGKHKRAELKYFSSTCYESTTGRKSDTLQFDNSVLIQKGLTLPKNGRDTKYFLLFSSYRKRVWQFPNQPSEHILSIFLLRSECSERAAT